MKMEEFLIGSLLIAVGFAVYSSGGLSANSDTFTDSYPGGSDWSTFGDTQNTFTDADGNLVLDSTGSTGYFYSDTFSKQRELRVDRVIYDADNIAANQDEVIYLTVELLDDGAVVDTVQHTVDEEGRYAIPLGNISDSYYESYRFDVEIASASPSPELSELSFEGSTPEGGEELGFGFMLLFFFLGILMIVRAA